MESAWKPVLNIIIIFGLLSAGLYAYEHGYSINILHMVRVHHGHDANARVIMTSPVYGVITYDGYDYLEVNNDTPTIHAYIGAQAYGVYTYMLYLPLNTSYREQVLQSFEKSFHTTLPVDREGLERLAPIIKKRMVYDEGHLYWRHSIYSSETITAYLGYFVGYYGPDEVLKHSAGMCIEYALLWAALYLAEGYSVTYVFLQGLDQHAFIVNADGVPIENTMYTWKNLSDALHYWRGQLGPLHVTEIVYYPDETTFVKSTVFEYG